MIRTLRKIGAVGLVSEAAPAADPLLRLRRALDERIAAVLGRSLCIRHVDAGSCNGCELEIHALGNPIYNLEGCNIRLVASPRHADLLLVTGPVAANMEAALRRTYDATPDPKLVVAVGDCGCTGGIFGERGASRGRVSNVIPVDVAVPGCPPSPTRILQAVLTAISGSASAGQTQSGSALHGS
jgi:Ni,Fe-hydrogenase III small subunit